MYRLASVMLGVVVRPSIITSWVKCTKFTSQPLGSRPPTDEDYGGFTPALFIMAVEIDLDALKT